MALPLADHLASTFRKKLKRGVLFFFGFSLSNRWRQSITPLKWVLAQTTNCAIETLALD
jgi:hypothetical protein